jgi:hypothetical protein
MVMIVQPAMLCAAAAKVLGAAGPIAFVRLWVSEFRCKLENGQPS